MRVLIADDDPFSSAIMQAVLTSGGHECVMARDGREAWEILQGKDAPRIVFLDWMMPEIDGIELCRRIRERPGAEYVYIAILSVRNKQRDITLGFHAGADDFITKPYQVEEVLARLLVAERLIRSTSGASMARALREARESRGGDVIVRVDHRVGRIIFFEGQVAWAHVSDEPGSLMAILDGRVAAEDVRAVIDECSQTGANFADVLVAWNLISRDHLREVLRAWIQAKIVTMAGFSLPEVIFSPERRATTSGMLFSPAEVLPAELLRVSGGPEPRAGAQVSVGELVLAAPAADGGEVVEPELAPRIAASLDRALRIDGARAAAVIDLRSGRCLDACGEALDLDVVWGLLRLAAQGELQDDLVDIMVTTHQRIFIARWYTERPRRAIFLALDRATATLALARRELAKCVHE